MRFWGAAPLTRQLVGMCLAAAIVLTACAGGGDGDAVVAQSPITFREAGFGPGALAIEAGAWIERVETIPGDWVPGLPVPAPVPPVCEVPEPLALQAISLAKFADGSNATAEVIIVEARVYDSEQVAENFVDLLNGDTAEACDRVSVQLLDALQLPGVRYSFGNGVGAPATVADAIPTANPSAARSYDFEIQASLSREDLTQIRTSVADGSTAITYSVLTLADRADALDAVVAGALFDDPAPRDVDELDLDLVADEIRTSALRNDDFADIWVLTTPLRFGGSGAPNICLTSSQVAGAQGLSWVSNRPGLGASQVEQRFQVYSDEPAAAAALEELGALGAACLPAELGLNDEFEAQTAATETVEVDGREVVLITVGLEQQVSGQLFEVEARIAATQVDETLSVLLSLIHI